MERPPPKPCDARRKLSYLGESVFRHILESSRLQSPTRNTQVHAESSWILYPQKGNFTMWGKRLSKACTLCGRAEYLSHALSSCPYLLEQGTWRHDSILSSIETLIKNEINSTDVDIIFALYQQCWTIPPDIIHTNQTPHIVIVNTTPKSIYILELTVSYERNITMEHKYKSEKYAGLIGGLQDIGWSTSYHAFGNTTILKIIHNQN